MSQTTGTLFDLQDENGIRVIRLAFRTLEDGITLDTLNTDLIAAVSAAPSADWIIDVARVQICSSALLGVLVNTMNHIRRAKGRLVLAGPSASIARAIHACSLHRLFVITGSKAEAMQQLK